MISCTIFILFIHFSWANKDIGKPEREIEVKGNHLLRRFDNTVNQSIITLLQQTNGKQLYYDFSNRLICTKFTDIYKFPLILVTDDFVLPAYEQTGIDVSQCTSLVFNITWIRTKRDLDPYNITLLLMRHDSTTNKPSNVSFFKRTLSSPNNTGIWPMLYNVPNPVQLFINQGDIADDGVTMFDFTNRTFLSINETLWFSFYVTVPQHFYYQGFVQ